MPLFAIHSGGPSPHITLVGNQEDLNKIGRGLESQTKVFKNADGHLEVGPFEVRGEALDGISFRLDENVQQLITDNEKLSLVNSFKIYLIWGVIISILYLAFRGAVSLFS